MHCVRLFIAVSVIGPALAACVRPAPVSQQASVAPQCVPGGELAASVYGSLAGELDWRGNELACEGMRRPDGRGARLRFEGPATDDSSASRLAFIIALPDLGVGETASGLLAGVTLMEVDAGRFFSSPEQAGCFADVERQEPLGDGNANEYLISGLLYCLSPLAEVNGAAGVSLRDLKFTGRLDWSEPR